MSDGGLERGPTPDRVEENQSEVTGAKGSAHAPVNAQRKNVVCKDNPNNAYSPSLSLQWGTSVQRASLSKVRLSALALSAHGSS